MTAAKQIAIDTRYAHAHYVPHLELDDIIDDNEVSIRKLKTDKAGGIDGLQSEHLKYGGPLLTLWLKQIFCAFTQLVQVPPSLLTGIICPIYTGKGKDPLSCHSYRGITITSVLMKVFEYTIATQQTTASSSKVWSSITHSNRLPEAHFMPRCPLCHTGGHTAQP